MTAGHPPSSSTLPILTVTSYPHWTQAMHKTAKFKGFADMEQSQTFGPTNLHMTSLNNNNNQNIYMYIYIDYITLDGGRVIKNISLPNIILLLF